MAQTENGVGISYKLPDGTMVWSRRDTWAELREDIRGIFGEESLAVIEEKLLGAWLPKQANKVAPLSVVPSANVEPIGSDMTAEEVAKELGATVAEEQEFPTCPRCGEQKNRWVPPGVSKAGKKYAGFYGCPTRGCPGR